MEGAIEGLFNGTSVDLKLGFKVCSEVDLALETVVGHWVGLKLGLMIGLYVIA